jgi:hypothetical protein
MIIIKIMILDSILFLIVMLSVRMFLRIVLNNIFIIKNRFLINESILDFYSLFGC